MTWDTSPTFMGAQAFPPLQEWEVALHSDVIMGQNERRAGPSSIA
jgi:hypothetical protein